MLYYVGQYFSRVSLNLYFYQGFLSISHASFPSLLSPIVVYLLASHCFYYLQCPTNLFSSSVLNRFLLCIIPPRYFPFICEDLCFFILSRLPPLEFPNIFFSSVPKLFLLLSPHRCLSHNSLKMSFSSVFKGFLLFSLQRFPYLQFSKVSFSSVLPL